MFTKIPSWLYKGAKIAVKSTIFGVITATVTDVSDKCFSYKPDRKGTDYACSVTYQNMILMYLDGSIKPLQQ